MTKENAPIQNTEGSKESNQPTKSKDLIEKGIAPELPKVEGNAQEGQPNQAGEPKGNESFTNIDPQTLPQELKSIYNSMLTDYKRKTQEISELRGNVTSETKQKAIEEALNNLSQEQFVQLANHPRFVQNLMTFLNQNGQQVNKQTQEEDVDVSYMTETERKIYEKNKVMESEINQLKNTIAQINNGNVRATITAQDANLTAKYGGLYKPEIVDGFLDQVLNGKNQLTRELIFKALDYDNAVKRAYAWGGKDSQNGDGDRFNASMLSQISGGGTEGYDVPKRQPKEDAVSYMTRLAEHAKTKVTQGRTSPFLTTSDRPYRK